MTEEYRKEIARSLISDPSDSFFSELSFGELQAFYGVCACTPVPSTASCARDEARRIIGEPESSELCRQALYKSNYMYKGGSKP